MVQGNGMDLSVFQFDYDMSFAVFFLGADKTIYGRYGTRTQNPKNADSEISMDGLAESMKAALAVHKARDRYEEALAAKTGPKPKHPTPESHPQLRKYQPKIQFGPNVAKSCVHCHQVRDVERLDYRNARKPVPDTSLFPYPMPSVLGLTLDKSTRAKVSDVEKGSIAAKAGIARGDEVLSIKGQPIVSVADIQWVLHHTDEAAELPFVLRDRTGKRKSATLQLPSGWRRAGDISWRVSTWDLRRMALGGIKLAPLPEADRRRLGLEGKMALLAEHVGQYNQHAVAKRAGVVKGDVLVGFDGIDDPWSESLVIAHGMQKRKSGDSVVLKMLRKGKPREFTIKLQ